MTSSLSATTARLRAMREAVSDGFAPLSSLDWVMCAVLGGEGFIKMEGNPLRAVATPAGRAWLKEHDKGGTPP